MAKVYITNINMHNETSCPHKIKVKDKRITIDKYGMTNKLLEEIVNICSLCCESCIYFKKLFKDKSGKGVICNNHTLKDKIDYFKDLIS